MGFGGLEFEIWGLAHRSVDLVAQNFRVWAYAWQPQLPTTKGYNTLLMAGLLWSISPPLQYEP